MSVSQMSIGEVARRAGLRASAVRYYEQIRILPRPQRIHGRRHYDEMVLHRLAVVQFGRAAGLTLEEIRVLFWGFPENAPASARWQKLARRKMSDIDGLLARLQGMRAMLEKILSCGCASLEECGRNMFQARARAATTGKTVPSRRALP